MSPNLKRCLSYVVGFVVAISALAQTTPCHFEDGVQYCENGTGEYPPANTQDPNSPAMFPSPRSISPTVSPLLKRSGMTSPSGDTVSATSVETGSAGTSVTALAGCHMHENVQYCTPVPTGDEIVVATQTSSSEVLPTAYTGCHSHDGDVYCITPEGEEVFIDSLSLASSDDDDDDDEGGQKCHFHAGVEHCTGGSSAEEATCERPDRDYNVKIRIGSLFIVLLTSSIAVFGPILLRRYSKNISTTGIRFTIIKQFGTGVIIATAFVHLLTHASLQFASECLGELDYEATTTAIAMAGAFLAFLVEFVGGRYVMHRRDQKAIVSGNSAGSSIEGVGEEKSQNPRTRGDLEMSRQSPPLVFQGGHGGHGHDIAEGDDKLSVWVMEAGIIFHSILIGVTTVVAGDSEFWNLAIVIIFHQMFEGLALGSRISTLSSVSTISKGIMATVFACITPFGMMIGIIVLNNFNGSDRTTILALGTLDALSAGILIWVGFVEMWAGDWVYGDLKRAGVLKTACAIGSLVAGMVLMGLLGKWA